jgi:asparagine synthase (glutamine-hydrolysing)
MAQDLQADFQTFAVGVTEQDFNELPYARTVADHHQTRHVEARVQSDLVQLLPEMIWHMDEPSDPIAACQYHAGALAAQHVKVVLGGDGGDELFGGFDRYLGVGYVDYYARVPEAIRRGVIGRLLAYLPENFTYKSWSQKMRWMQELSLLPTTADRYAAATLFFRFTHTEKKALFSPELWAQLEHLDSADIITEVYNRAPAQDSIERMIYADYHTRLPEHSLMLTDRMTMAHGLELRSPFLDHELVQMMAAYPRQLKIRKRELKHILRRLGRDYLPPEIVNREKQGFMFPIAYWFRHELHSFLQGYLLDSHFVRQGIFRSETISQLIEDHHRNRIDNHVRLWMLLNLAIWHDLYIENHSLAEVLARMKAHL